MNRLATLARQLAPPDDSAHPPPHPPAPLFSGRVVVITGAASGIGAACARRFAAHGAELVLADLDAVALAATAAQCRAIAAAAGCGGGGPPRTVTEVAPLDVTSPGAAAALRAAVERAHGGRADALVNNAGYTLDRVLHRMPDASFQAMLDVHVAAPFRLIRDLAGPLMRDAGKREAAEGGGAGAATSRYIVNVSSTSGTHGNAGQANYAAAKAAVLGLTKTVAKEWGPWGVRCNAVAFGLIDTRLTRDRGDGAAIVVGGETVALGVPGAAAVRGFVEAMAPLRRVGTADEAAGAVLFLAGDLASFVTGQCLEVDGGAHM